MHSSWRAASFKPVFSSSSLQALSGTAKCDAKVFALNYNTAGALLMAASNCTAPMSPRYAARMPGHFLTR